MTDFFLGNYALFGVVEPARTGGGGLTVPFLRRRCCNACPSPVSEPREAAEVSMWHRPYRAPAAPAALTQYQIFVSISARL